MFKSKTKTDPDTPGIRESLSGEYRDDFVQGMANEIAELEKHDTWEVIKRSEIKPVTDKNGKEMIPSIIPLTWAFKNQKMAHRIIKENQSKNLCQRRSTR